MICTKMLLMMFDFYTSLYPLELFELKACLNLSIEFFLGTIACFISLPMFPGKLDLLHSALVLNCLDYIPTNVSPLRPNVCVLGLIKCLYGWLAFKKTTLYICLWKVHV